MLWDGNRKSETIVTVNRAQISLILLTVLAATSMHAAPSDDQIIHNPGMLAGPWEGKSGDDLVGVYLKIETALKSSVEYLTDFQVRVDQVVDRDWGWFVVDGRRATWDGTRLRINHRDPVTRRETAVDLIFDPTENVWSGTFGSNRTVRLERSGTVFDPKQRIRRTGSSGLDGTAGASELFGVWRSDAPTLTPECLHVAVRRNGSPVAWLDRVLSHGDYRGASYGGLFTPPSFTDKTISLDVDSPFAANSRTHTGILIDDQRMKWTPGFLSYVLTRSPQSACASLLIDGPVREPHTPAKFP